MSTLQKQHLIDSPFSVLQWLEAHCLSPFFLVTSFKMTTSLLPDDLMLEILSRVPAKSVLRSRCVSKHWLALIDASDFIKMHLHRTIQMDSIDFVLVCKNWNHRPSYLGPTIMYSIDQDIRTRNPPSDLFLHSRVAGSCNGLVCLIKDAHFLVLNPITREYKIVTFDNELDIGYDFRLNYGVYGLGYDSDIDDYKLVRFMNDARVEYDPECWTSQHHSKRNSEINVYSLNDSSFLTISDVPYCYANLEECGIYLNGAVHWVGKRINTRYEKLIICFDIREEVIREFPLPDVVDKNSRVTLGVLGGQLCVFLNMYCEIWAMKNYGLSISWYKLASMDRNVLSCSVFHRKNHASSSQSAAKYSSSVPEYYMYTLLSAARVLCFSKSGEILLSCARRLFLYNPEQNTSRHIEIPGIYKEHEVEQIITNVASRVRLNSGSYLPLVEREPS